MSWEIKREIRYASKAIPLYTLNYFGLKKVETDFPPPMCIFLYL